MRSIPITLLAFSAVAFAQHRTLPAGVIRTGRSVKGHSYYVSNTGNDSNPGTLRKPWATPARAASFTPNPGDRVLFDACSLFRGPMNISGVNGTSAAHIKYGVYGSAGCTSPTFDAATPVSGWTLQNGTTYQASFAGSGYKGFVDFDDGPIDPLILQNSISAVNATPGSIFFDGSLVYVNLLDGDNPANHTVEVSAQPSNITVTNSSYVDFDGFTLIRPAVSGFLALNTQYSTLSNLTVYNWGNLQKFAAGNLLGGILIIPTGSTALAGWTITNPTVLTGDVPNNSDQYMQGIGAFGTTGFHISRGMVATVNAAAIAVRTFFTSNTNNDTALIEGVETTANQGGIFNESTGGVNRNNYVHDGSGLCIQILNQGSAYRNTCSNLTVSADGTLYNGIEDNGGVGGTIYDNYVTGTSGASVDIEGGATGVTLQANILDPTVTGTILRVTTDAEAGFNPVMNTYIEHPDKVVVGAGPVSYGASGSSEYYMSMAQFRAAAPNAGGDIRFSAIPNGTTSNACTVNGSQTMVIGGTSVKLATCQ